MSVRRGKGREVDKNCQKNHKMDFFAILPIIASGNGIIQYP